MSAQNSSRGSRQLGTLKHAVSVAKNTSYSIEGIDLTPAAKNFSSEQIVPSYFSFPEKFLDLINAKQRTVKTLEPVAVAGVAMSEIDPLLLLSNMAVSMKPSDIEHRFPHSDPTEQTRQAARLVRSIRRCLQRPAALRSLLRDPELLVYLRNSFYAEDTPSFLSVCRFVLSDEGSDKLRESSFVASMEQLVETALESCDSQ